jgi:hypothetical protein
LIAAIAFGGWLLAAAYGWTRGAGGIDRAAQAVAATMATFILVLANAASLLGYSGPIAIALAVVLALAGWIIRSSRHANPPERGDRPAAGTLWVLAASGIALLLPLLFLPVPMDTDAQGFGYLSVTIRQGGSLTTLSPWHPEVGYLYSPGALLTFAALSDMIPSLPMSAVMMGAAHTMALLFILLSHGLGVELAQHSGGSARSTRTGVDRQRATRWGLISVGVSSLSFGLWTALLDAHYTAIFGLVFALSFVLSTLRFIRLGDRLDAATAALFLAACWMTHVDTAIALTAGLGAMLLVWPLAGDRPDGGRWLTLAFIVPATAAAVMSPWLVHISALIGSGIRSPFRASLSNWRPLLLYQGILWPVLAAVGVWLYRRRHLWALSMGGWLVMVAVLSLIDIRSGPLGASLDQLLRFSYPFGIAWHGPIVPMIALSTAILAHASSRISTAALLMAASRLAAAAILLLIGLLLAHRPLLGWTKGKASIYGSFSTSNDVRAMVWIRANAPEDARILNYPGDYPAGRDWEAAWAAVVTERDSIYFRWQPFFLVDGQVPTDRAQIGREQRELLAFWRDPLDPASGDLLRDAGIGFVLIPELVSDPGAWTSAWRWRRPDVLPSVAAPGQAAPFLDLVFQAGGAQVLRVRP